MRRVLSLVVIILAGFGLGMVISDEHPDTALTAGRTLTVTIVPHQLQTAPTDLLPTDIGAIAIDADSGEVLFAKDSTGPRPIASLTKMMTVYLVLQDHKLGEMVTVGTLPEYGSEDETLGLVQGQQLTVQALVTAALIPSDNDAADALAIYDAGSRSAFITKMNRTLTQWQIGDAHYASASGLEDSNNYASPAALTHIAQLVLTSPTMRSLVATPAATISTSNGTFYQLNNTDDLLATGNYYGIKTGYTAAAGQCFVGLTTINGHSVITVVLGSADRFGDSLRLRNWIEGAWTWQ